MVAMRDRTIGGYVRSLYAPASSNFGKVDARLADIVRTAAAQFPYRVAVTPSGGYNRRGSTKNHPAGRAVDVQIYDANGKPLGNLRNAESFRVYEQWAQTARRVQMEKYPELNDKFRWGGYFQQGVPYDQMHLDIGGGGMALGSWEEGLNAAGRRGLPGAVSVGMLQSDLEALGYTGQSALRDFQRAAGITVDGKFGPETRRALNAAMTNLQPATPAVDPALASARAPGSPQIPTPRPNPATVVRQAGMNRLDLGGPSISGGLELSPDADNWRAVGQVPDAAAFSMSPRRFGLSGIPDILSVPTSFPQSGPVPPLGIPTAPLSPAAVAEAGRASLEDRVFAAPSIPVERQALPAPRVTPALGADFMDRVAEQAQLSAMENAAIAAMAPRVPSASDLAREFGGAALNIGPVDMSRPRLANADGSFSTEETITVGAMTPGGQRYFNVPTIVNGQRVGAEQAISLFNAGQNPAVGNPNGYQSLTAAEEAARARTEALGALRAPADQSMPAMTSQTIADRVDFASMPRPGVGVTPTDVLAAAARAGLAPQFSPGVASPTQTPRVQPMPGAPAVVSVPAPATPRPPADQADRVAAAAAAAPIPRPPPSAPVPVARPAPVTVPTPVARPAPPVPAAKPAVAVSQPPSVAPVPTASPARMGSVAIPTPQPRPAVTPSSAPIDAMGARPSVPSTLYYSSPTITNAQFNERFSAAVSPAQTPPAPIPTVPGAISRNPYDVQRATIPTVPPTAAPQPVQAASVPIPVARPAPTLPPAGQPDPQFHAGGSIPRAMDPAKGLGMAGRVAGTIVAGPIGGLVGGYLGGKAGGGWLTQTLLPTPTNYIGSGLGPIGSILAGSASPGSYAGIRNMPSGASNGYWSNTAPGGRPAMTYSMGGRTITSWSDGMGGSYTTYS